MQSTSRPGTSSPPRRSVLWIVLPQVVTRLTSFYVFAAVAQHAGAGLLGALAVGVAIAGIAVPLAPAIVGKALAAEKDPERRVAFGRMGTAAAVWGGVLVAVALLVAALLTAGLTRTALLGGAIGLPATLVVEVSFWRSVFVEDRRVAALWYSGAYVLQAAVVTVCVPLAHGAALVIASFVALALPAAILVVRTPDLGPGAARTWLTEHRSRWVPYVLGTLAAVGVVQATPAVLSAAAGFGAAGVYRASELAFGGTNLLIGVAAQALLTQDVARPRRMYATVSAGLVVVAVVNGVVVAVLPGALLNLVFGGTAPMLVGVVTIVSFQRAAMGASTVGNILIIPRVNARVAGVLDVVSAGASFAALVVGALLDDLRGALIGLAVAEIALAVGAVVLLRRTTGAEQARVEANR